MPDVMVLRSCLAGPLAALLAMPAGAASGPPARRDATRAVKPALRKPLPAQAAKGGPALDLAGAVRLELAPPSFTLDGPRAVEHLLATAVFRDGTTRDVTDAVTLTLSRPEVVSLARGVAAPKADGKTTVVARLGTLASSPAEVTVRNSRAPVATQFVNDVMPILAKTGCNSTACHGSPAGKGGLKLSLFGYEPDLDHAALTKDGGGKRIDLKNPEVSLLLQKATGVAAHGGGQRLQPGSRDYGLLLSWIREGAPGIDAFEARVQKVELIPAQSWIPAPGARQRLVALATLSDGSTVDVTDRALYSSDDDGVAAVDAGGVVSTRKPGEAAVMVRYLGQVAVARVAVLPPARPDTRTASRPVLHNGVDELVQAKLDRLRVEPSGLCSDEEFIRRATLDVCGVIPTPEEVRAFLADSSAGKRPRLVETLLARPEFVDLWTMKWHDTLRISPLVLKYTSPEYGQWVREQVAANRPYDEFVRDLLTATGRPIEVGDDSNLKGKAAQKLERLTQGKKGKQFQEMPFNPATNYYLVSRDPLDIASATSQVFLGVRIECARCHNHPFERWTQNDYYGFAAYFAGIGGLGKGKNPTAVMPNPRAPALRLPRTNEEVDPHALDDQASPVPAGGDARETLAAWITSPQNPYFAKAIANRIWSHYFGRGIVEPVDDFRVTNPASNPELLEALGRELVDHKFDLKALHRLILNSATYQRSSRPNATNRDDARNFSRFYPKRLMAEQLYDSICEATGVGLGGEEGRRRKRGAPRRLARNGAGAEVERVMQLPTLSVAKKGAAPGPVQFLETFGKPRRESVCECERSNDGNMGQALALLNGDVVNARLADPDGRVQQLARSDKPDPAVVEELYLAILSRRPTADQSARAAALLRSAPSRREGVEDLAWSLLNSREFLFNH